MSEYYELKEKAGLEALGDMQLDVIDGLLNYANEMVDDLRKNIKVCDIREISFGAYRISQQLEYAKEVNHSSMIMFPHQIAEKYRLKISDVEADFLKMLSNINKDCKCSVKS